MATQLFLLEAAASTHRGTNSANLIGTNVAWLPCALSTARGNGVVGSGSTPTVAGATPGVVLLTAGIATEWISEPVAADVTISGTITANIWAAEDNMSANVAINVVIDIIRSDSSNTIVEIVRSTRVTECAITTRAVNNFTTGMTSGSYTAQTLNRGDRLRIRVFGDDVGTMASGFNFSIGYDGTTAAADGDTYVTFTENITFESAPGGSVVYLTNAHSGLSGAPALISDFTGADENPLSEGGNWATLDTSSNPLQRISNAVAAVTTGNNQSYWTPSNFGPDLEAYLTLSTLGIGGIIARIQGEGGAATFDGYRVQASSATVSTISRVDNGVPTTLMTTATSSWASGDKVGMKIIGSTIQLWQQKSGSSDWNLILSLVDTTYPSAGKIGIYGSATTVRMDDFYAATDSNLFTQKAWTSRGAGVVSYLSDTDAGFVTPLLTNEWFTPQLQAVTLTGLAQANIRALESSTSANASLRCEIARVESDGTSPTVWAAWNMSADNGRTGELNTSQTAETINISGDDLAISDGQRLRIRLYNDDMPTTAMGNAFTVQRFYNGTSGGASGDSYITFPVTLTEYTPPAPPQQLPFSVKVQNWGWL